MHTFELQVDYHKKLQKTEKTQLYNEKGETVLLISATYLRKSKDEKSDEVFVVGLYSEMDTAKPELTLNNVKPENVKKIEKNSEHLHNISFVSDWNRFYVVSFPYTHDINLTLVIHNKMYGNGKMHFAKVAKYLLTKQER